MGNDQLDNKTMLWIDTVEATASTTAFETVYEIKSFVNLHPWLGKRNREWRGYNWLVPIPFIDRTGRLIWTRPVSEHEKRILALYLVTLMTDRAFFFCRWTVVDQIQNYYGEKSSSLLSRVPHLMVVNQADGFCLSWWGTPVVSNWPIFGHHFLVISRLF